eukprot:scaffold53_cov381-Pavlova_lutheri.AAC.17
MFTVVNLSVGFLSFPPYVHLLIRCGVTSMMMFVACLSFACGAQWKRKGGILLVGAVNPTSTLVTTARVSLLRGAYATYNPFYDAHEPRTFQWHPRSPSLNESNRPRNISLRK